MSSSQKPSSGPTDPWKDEGQIFRAVAVLALLFFEKLANSRFAMSTLEALYNKGGATQTGWN